MKKLFLFGAFMAAMTFTACEKEDQTTTKLNLTAEQSGAQSDPIQSYNDHGHEIFLESESQNPNHGNYEVTPDGRPGEGQFLCGGVPENVPGCIPYAGNFCVMSTGVWYANGKYHQGSLTYVGPGKGVIGKDKQYTVFAEWGSGGTKWAQFHCS